MCWRPSTRDSVRTSARAVELGSVGEVPGQLVLECVPHGLGTGPGTRLDEDAVHVLVCRARPDAEPTRDRPVGESPDEQAEHLLLARAEHARALRAGPRALEAQA